MCGLCANYTDSGIFCEYCAASNETERYVAEEAEKLNLPEPALGLEITDPELEGRFRKRGGGGNFFQLAVIVVSVGIIGFQVVTYNRTTLAAEVEVGSPEYAVNTFYSCLKVFKEVGALLASGDPAAESLRCEQPDLANVVLRNAETIRIAHPSPEIFGCSEISVSSDNLDPQVF